jgi:hypothetical protein
MNKSSAKSFASLPWNCSYNSLHLLLQLLDFTHEWHIRIYKQLPSSPMAKVTMRPGMAIHKLTSQGTTPR